MHRGAKPGPPLWLNLELTYRCPLHCVFCYNPTDFAATGGELGTEEWIRVLREARAVGAVQLGLSGGEPLVRDDLEAIVAEAHRLGFYTNLITSGVGLSEPRIQALKSGGLDHIQLSFQDSSRQMNDFLSSTRTFELKSKTAALIKRYEYPMVLERGSAPPQHRSRGRNIADGGAIGRGLCGTRQHPVLRLGVAQSGSAAAQPRAIETSGGGHAGFRERLAGRMKIYFVVPDYFETRPKPCMNGLGSIFLTIAPDGTALPCHAARMLPGLEFPNVRDARVQQIWFDSAGFQSISRR